MIKRLHRRLVAAARSRRRAPSSLAACGSDDEDEPRRLRTPRRRRRGSAGRSSSRRPKPDTFKRAEPVLERGEEATATVETSCGSFEIALDTESSPKTANSFAFLAEQGFYDGTTFHRIAPGFVIQGGDPNGDGTGGPGYSVVEAPPQDTVYSRGLVAMAKTGNEPSGTSGSQFFVVTAPADAGLPPDYAVLGQVSSGEAVVDVIAELGDPATEQPLQVVTIDSVTVESE